MFNQFFLDQGINSKMAEYTRTCFDKEIKRRKNFRLIMADVQGQLFIWQLVDIGNHSGSCPSVLPRVERKGEGRS